MLNPQENSQDLTRVSYDYMTHRNIPWNILEYKPNRQYLDPIKAVQDRQYAKKKKGQKDTKYVTKRGYYLDYHNKIMKVIPGADRYQKNEPWDFSALKKQSESVKVNKSAIKYTYLERIQMQQKNRKSPGIGTYSLQKSLKDIEAQLVKSRQKKIKVSQKKFFHEDTTFLADKSPGSGNYNPHSIQKKLKLDKTDYKFWVTKHGKLNQKIEKREKIKPAPGTYSPLSQSFTTFASKSNLTIKQLEKKNAFGKDQRFPYLRPNKKKIVEKRPDSITYNTSIEWKGKTVSPKKKMWNEAIWKGYSQSVYH